MRSLPLAAALLAAVTLAAVAADDPKPAKPRTENVILVMLDGLRWQDVYTGADEALLDKTRGGVADVAAVKKRFWRDTPEERRSALMPFFWGTVATEGQVHGNKLKKSVGRVTNTTNVSYPGYSEVLCGFVDPLILGNAKISNRNETVLEWLHKKPGFEGKVAAFTSWEVFPYIINDKRSGIPVNGGYAPLKGVPDSPEVQLLNRLTAETPLDGEETRYDAFTFRAAMLYLKAKKPRVTFISFDETDAQGHAGRYDRLLHGAHKNDAFLKELWETVQSLPEYKGKTTLIVTTDHGRGDAPVEWKSHGAKTAGAEFFWFAIMGPDTPALGEVKDTEFTQTQVAATTAAALGYNYAAAVPRAGKPIAGAVKPGP
jgi:hypothetical protein